MGDECWVLMMCGIGCWVVDVEWWVLMVSIKFIVNPHIITTQPPTSTPPRNILTKMQRKRGEMG